MTTWQSPGSAIFPGVASAADCCAQCSRNASCNAWTYNTVHQPFCATAPFAMITYGQNLTSGTTSPPTWQPPEPAPPLPATGECQYVQDTVYDTAAAGDTWRLQVEATSAGQCCSICRSLPECSVSHYQPAPWTGDVNGPCDMRGKVDLSRPTHVPNSTACVVKTRPAPPRPPPPRAMNVLYIVSDDARPEMPSFGQNYVKAPNLAALSARGLTFMNAYCQQSICSPSRNSFMSGKRPQTTRVWNFIDDFRQDFPFHLSFPQYFKQHNYSTTGHGKLYHPGKSVTCEMQSNNPSLPRRQTCGATIIVAWLRAPGTAGGPRARVGTCSLAATVKMAKTAPAATVFVCARALFPFNWQKATR